MKKRKRNLKTMEKSKKMTNEEVVSVIGEPAIFELLAEECSELAHSSLKMARVIRGENPTPMTASLAADRWLEEMADVYVTLKIAEGTSVYNDSMVKSIMEIKEKRMNDRLSK